MLKRLAVVGIRLFRRSPPGELSLAEDVSEDVLSWWRYQPDDDDDDDDDNGDDGAHCSLNTCASGDGGADCLVVNDGESIKSVVDEDQSASAAIAAASVGNVDGDGGDRYADGDDGLDVFAMGDGDSILPIVDDAQCVFAHSLFAAAAADRVEGGLHCIPVTSTANTSGGDANVLCPVFIGHPSCGHVVSGRRWMAAPVQLRNNPAQWNVTSDCHTQNGLFLDYLWILKTLSYKARVTGKCEENSQCPDRNKKVFIH